MTSTGDTASTPPEAPPSERPRLTRSKRDRVVAGVAGGLAEYFGVDAVVFRIGFVAASLLGGAGLLVYGLAWLFVPETGARRTLGEHLLRRCGKVFRGASWPTIAGISLLVIAAVVLFDSVAESGGGDIVLSGLLVAGGVALLAWRPAAQPRPSEAPGDGDAPPTATPEVAPATPPPSPSAPPAPKETSLTRLTICALLIAGGATGLADAADLIEISVEEFLAGGLAFTGLVLVISTWWGRARGLLVVGALLTLALGGLTAVDVPLSAGFGERDYSPERPGDVRDRYRLFAGEMRLDLGAVDFPEGTTEIEAELAFGELRVIVPARSTVIVNAETEAGDVRVFDERDNGVGADIETRTRGTDGSTVRLDLHVVAGEIRVTDAPA